jgi:hypothetical protein
MNIAAHGVSLDLPAGWDGRIFARSKEQIIGSSEPPISSLAAPFEERYARVHTANFALPSDDGDFGVRATSAMGAGGVFTSLVEYQPGDGLVPGAGLFAAVGPPEALEPRDFDPRALLRAIPGQAGTQRFFTAAGRPFCLYAVLGSGARAGELAGEVNRVLGSLRISQ